MTDTQRLEFTLDSQPNETDFVFTAQCEDAQGEVGNKTATILAEGYQLQAPTVAFSSRAAENYFGRADESAPELSADPTPAFALNQQRKPPFSFSPTPVGVLAEQTDGPAHSIALSSNDLPRIEGQVDTTNYHVPPELHPLHHECLAVLTDQQLSLIHISEPTRPY